MTKKALARSEFNSLPQVVQLKLLQQNGVYVGKRKHLEMTAVLFQLNAFYVEVFYLQYRKVVAHLDTSDDTDILRPYLDQVYVRDIKERNGEEK